MESKNSYSKTGIRSIKEFRALLDSSYGKEEGVIYDRIPQTIDKAITDACGLEDSTGVAYNIEFVAGGITIFSLGNCGFEETSPIWDKSCLRSHRDRYNLLNFNNIDVIKGLFDSLEREYADLTVTAKCIEEEEDCDYEWYRTYSVTFTYVER